MDALHALIENPRNAISFNENCAVTNAKAEANSNPEARTRPNIWRSENNERHAIAAQNARQQHVAELPPRGLYHGRFIVSKQGICLLISN